MTESWFSRREWVLSAVAFAAARRLPGQQPGVRYTANVSVVNVLATVRNKQGQIVRDLSKEDFKLDEDGRPQTIGYFSVKSDLPLQPRLCLRQTRRRRGVPENPRGGHAERADVMPIRLRRPITGATRPRKRALREGIGNPLREALQ